MTNKYFLKFVFTISAILLMIILPLQAQTVEVLQREFTEFRFGAFIHFGIRTFTGGEWGEANQDVSKFNPTDLDCNQWAEAFVAAKMKFAILTTKHHDGFCLWNSAYTENDVASSPWKDGNGDVVQEYVEAFRAHGLEPSLYYSVWDNTGGVGNNSITENDMEFIKGQITELLTNYGDIKMLFVDGWSWKMGHKEVPYQEIHNLVKDLQPGCLLVDNTHVRELYNVDMLHFEDGSPCPEDNKLPSILSLLINKKSGNGWFWDDKVPTADLLSVNEIVTENLNYLEPRWCPLVLNCPPNPEGKLDDNIVDRLTEVGLVWSPDMNRPTLPQQDPQIEWPVTPLSASSISGTASYAIDGLNDRYYYSVWQTSSSLDLPQYITIDLGHVYNNICILSYLPKYEPYINPLTEGSIKSYKIYASTDNVNFTEIASGEWNGDIHMKVVTFTPTTARHIRLEAITAVDDFAAATEIAVGREDNEISLKNPQEKLSVTKFMLEQNNLNPLNQSIKISYYVPESNFVSLKIYDMLGRDNHTLVSTLQETNTYSINFNANELSSGIYFLRLKIGVPSSSTGYCFVETKKMLLFR